MLHRVGDGQDALAPVREGGRGFDRIVIAGRLQVGGVLHDGTRRRCRVRVADGEFGREPGIDARRRFTRAVGRAGRMGKERGCVDPDGDQARGELGRFQRVRQLDGHRLREVPYRVLLHVEVRRRGQHRRRRGEAWQIALGQDPHDTLDRSRGDSVDAPDVPSRRAGGHERSVEHALGTMIGRIQRAPGYLRPTVRALQRRTDDHDRPLGAGATTASWSARRIAPRARRSLRPL